MPAEREPVGSIPPGGLVFVTPDAHKALGLARALGGLRVLTGAPPRDGGSAEGCAPPEALAALREAGAEVVAVPVDGERNTTRALLESEVAAERLATWGAPVMLFRPDATSSARLESLGCPMVGADPRVARRFENKKAFRALCRRSGLPVVETHELTWPPGRDNRAVWGPYEGRVVVIQTARGFAGKRTWLWRVGDEPPRLGRRLAGRPVLLAPRVDGPTFTANAVVLDGGVRVGAPMRQITGDPRLTSLPLASSGVAIAPPGSEAVADELARLVRAVGERAARAGFVGFFGIDAVGEPGALELIEMNARLTATLTVATLAELAAGHRPLLIDHVLACLDRGELAADVGCHGISGGHVLVRRASGHTAQSPPLGEYRVDDDRLTPVRSGAAWPAAGHVTVWPAGADWGTPAEDRARLLFSDAVMDGEGALTALVERALAEVVRTAG